MARTSGREELRKRTMQRESRLQYARWLPTRGRCFSKTTGTLIQTRVNGMLQTRNWKTVTLLSRTRSILGPTLPSLFRFKLHLPCTDTQTPLHPILTGPARSFLNYPTELSTARTGPMPAQASTDPIVAALPDLAASSSPTAVKATSHAALAVRPVLAMFKIARQATPTVPVPQVVAAVCQDMLVWAL
ncbi:MAG: hypothetical protein Q9170_005153, partial [Blastenia crenularia]